MNYFSKPIKNKVAEEFGLQESKRNLQISLVKFGFKVSKTEKPNNLLFDTNETFLSKQIARLRKVWSLELLKNIKTTQSLFSFESILINSNLGFCKT